MSAPAKKPAARRNSGARKQRPAAVKVNPPEEFTGLPKPEEVAAQGPPSMYPKGTELFTYKPKDGGKAILLPLNGFERPDKLWHFDVAQLPILNQTWAWMDRAGVPKIIQRQTQMLPDAEYFEMYNAWFDAMVKFNQSAPKGALTAEK